MATRNQMKIPLTVEDIVKNAPIYNTVLFFSVYVLLAQKKPYCGRFDLVLSDSFGPVWHCSVNFKNKDEYNKLKLVLLMFRSVLDSGNSIPWRKAT